MNALGELTLETTQTDGSGFAGGHGQLPQTGDRDHPNAVPRNLDQASRERLGGAWDGETVRDDHVGIESLAYFEEQGMLIPRTQSGALNLDWWWPPDEEEEPAGRRLTSSYTGASRFGSLVAIPAARASRWRISRADASRAASPSVSGR